MKNNKYDPKEPTNNFLLAQLPKNELAELTEHLEFVHLRLGMMLYEPRETRDYVYFPTQGIVSIIQPLEEGSSCEIALIGSEGLVGITGFLGGDTQPNRAVVQSRGAALRIRSDIIREKFRKSGNLMTLILLYTQILYAQVAQSAVCNRHHNLQQQLCRWLLLSLDRIDCDELEMTQELIAGMLGVRREGITRAAGDLQRQHIIEYHRGSIKVLDRQRLEEQCCECYVSLSHETARLAEYQKHLR